MLRILIANAKGGCGKTTIATQLAAAFANMGHRTVLADADRQRSSLGWLARRPQHLAAIAGLDWRKEVGPPAQRTERLVVDAGPALRGSRIVELVKAADLIVLPVLPSAFDEASTRRFLDRLDRIGAVAKGRKPVAVIANRIRAGTRATARLESFLGGVDRPIVARLRDSQFYAESAVEGLSLFDAPSRRVRDLGVDWRPLLDFIARAAGDGRARPEQSQ